MSCEDAIVCDNKSCEYVIKSETCDPFKDQEFIRQYINMPCPRCGEKLLTMDDFILAEKLLKEISRANRWFGWLLIFVPINHKRRSTTVSTYNKIKIEP